MARRDSNMIEASLLPPPSVAQCIAAIKAAADNAIAGTKNELYEEIGRQEVEGPRGTNGVQTTAVKLMLQFEAVRQDKKVAAKD